MFSGGRCRLHYPLKNPQRLPIEAQFKRGLWELHPLQASGKRQHPLRRKSGSLPLFPGPPCVGKRDEHDSLRSMLSADVIIKLT